MICRVTKHGSIYVSSSNFLSILSVSFHSSPICSNPKPKFTPHKTSVTKRSTPVTVRTALVSHSVSSPIVSSISSLLSDKTIQCEDLNTLLKDSKEQLNSDIVLQVLMNYKQFGRVKTLEFFSWAGTQMSFQFDDLVIEYIADFLGRRKLFDDMKCLLVTVFSYRGRVSCRVFSTCIRYLGRKGRISEALCLFQEMETRFNCKPDNFVYNNMLYVLCKKELSGELIDVAVSIFRKIEVPDTYSYSNILVGLCKFGRFETALEVFQEMGRVGLVPTRSAVNLLIREICSLSEKQGATEKVWVTNVHKPFNILVPNLQDKPDTIEPAVGMFWAVHDLGLLPSSFVIIRFISELCRLGRVEEAMGILKVIEEKNMSCMEEGGSVVIKALCERRQVEECSHLFRRMMSEGLKLKVDVYNSIIFMLCKVGNLQEAEKVFKIMNKQRCLPDSVTYTALVHAYGEAKNWEGAYDLLIEMLGLGWVPHFHTYSLVADLLKENEQMDLSFKLERKLETQMLLQHCKRGQLEDAYQKLNSMMEKGLHPSMYAREAFKRAFQKQGKIKVARELLEKMDEACKIEAEI